MMKEIAVFDFDGTLIKSDSFIKFARFAVGDRKFLTAIVLSLPWIFCWKIGIMSGGRAKEHIFGRLFKGMPEIKWLELCRNFIPIIERDTNPQMMECLQEHQSYNHETMIVTASPTAWVHPWAEYKGIDKVIGTEVEVDAGGMLTGRFRTPNCSGVEKVVRLKEEYPDFDQYKSWGYGDSSSDMYILDEVSVGEMINKKAK